MGGPRSVYCGGRTGALCQVTQHLFGLGIQPELSICLGLNMKRA